MSAKASAIFAPTERNFFPGTSVSSDPFNVAAPAPKRLSGWKPKLKLIGETSPEASARRGLHFYKISDIPIEGRARKKNASI